MKLKLFKINLMNKTIDLFVKVQDVRYKLSAIKRYEPFRTVNTDILADKYKSVKFTPGDKYGIYIYFSTNGAAQRVHHYFENKKERDSVVKKLDQIFNVSENEKTN